MARVTPTDPLVQARTELEQRVAERTAELYRSKQVLELFVTHAPAAIAMFDRDMKYLAVSQRWSEDYQLGPQNLIGRSHHEIFPEIPARWKAGYQRCLAGAIEKCDEDSFQRIDGTLEWTRWEIHPWYESPDKVGGLLMFTEVITARKQAEFALQTSAAELQTSNAALEKALRTKDEFLAAMSHELRTPLTGILGLAEALQMPYYGLLNEKQSKAVGNIGKNGRRLLAVINDVLDYSKILSGGLFVNPQPCALGALCQRVLQTTRSQAESKHQQVHFVMGPAEITLTTDEQHMRRILLALISNAIKFTAQNGELGIDVSGNRETQQVKLTVWDTGIGIREADLPRLFQPFVQLDASLARSYEGTGLGLVLAKEFAHLIGASIAVESVFGQGSRFTITLPWPG